MAVEGGIVSLKSLSNLTCDSLIWDSFEIDLNAKQWKEVFWEIE